MKEARILTEIFLSPRVYKRFTIGGLQKKHGRTDGNYSKSKRFTDFRILKCLSTNSDTTVPVGSRKEAQAKQTLSNSDDLSS